jgi:hypothetical protein
MMSKQAFMVGLLGFVFLPLVGVSGLFFPEKIQTYAMQHSSGILHQKINPFLAWMRTRQYIWSLRVIGIVSLGAAGLLLVILIQTFRVAR